jgi:hypothetical protein
MRGHGRLLSECLTEKVRVWNKCQVKAKILPEDQLAEKFKDLVI